MFTLFYIMLHQFTSFYISLHIFTLFYIMLHYLTMLTMQDHKFFPNMYPSSPLTVPGLCRVGAQLVSEREVEVGLSSAAHQTRTARYIVPQDTTRNVQKGSTYIKMQVRLWNHMGRNIRNMSFHATLLLNDFKYEQDLRQTQFVTDLHDDGHQDTSEMSFAPFEMKPAKLRSERLPLEESGALSGLQHTNIWVTLSNQQNYCNTNVVLLRLGLSELAQNLHNR